MDLLQRGNRNRTQHPTAANEVSSRSHAVLQVGKMKQTAWTSSVACSIGRRQAVVMIMQSTATEGEVLFLPPACGPGCRAALLQVVVESRDRVPGSVENYKIGTSPHDGCGGTPTVGDGGRACAEICRAVWQASDS